MTEKAMNQTSHQDSLLRLAGALSEDIAATSGEELLVESADDFGDRRALATQFDAIIMPMTKEFETKTNLQTRSLSERAAPGFGPWVAQLWQRHAASISSIFLPRSPQWAVASLLVLIVMAGTAVLYLSDRLSGPSNERFAQSQSTETPKFLERYVVRLSWRTNSEEAFALFRSLQTRYPSLLGGRHAIVRSNPLAGRPDGERFYLAVGPFATMEEARELCDRLKTAGSECSVAEG